MARATRWLAAASVMAGVWSGSSVPVHSGALSAVVRDHRGQPVEDAVVVVVAPEAKPVTPPARPGRETVDQIDREFVPHVKPVVMGTLVYFPNKDDIRHHVYSFSPAKRFELPLYVGTPAEPVVFDRPGVVTIGCNIHDWMIGHIYVAETPHFAKTGVAGRVRLDNLPAGRYAVRVWHPRMEAPEESTRRTLGLARSGVVEIAWELRLKPDLRPRRAPVPGQRGYR
jgi:plastocyanin